MSRCARDWAWDQAVSSTQKLVLLSLAEHANDEGECWPCGARLRALTGLSVRALRNAVRELEAMDLIRLPTGWRDTFVALFTAVFNGAKFTGFGA